MIMVVFFVALLLTGSLLAIGASEAEAAEEVERWGIFELSLEGPSNGNPFLDVEVNAQFTCNSRVIEANGFYDGDGIYRVRLMPDTLGVWRYVTKSNKSELDGKVGQFTCVGPSPGNHGQVEVRNTYYLAYADGTPYFQIGTTCYAWAHQGDDMEEQTLETLKNAPFNKMRMCVFPKSYAYNKNEPQYYPFEGTPLTDWNYTRFNPEFFQHFEKRVGDLRDLGIEADLILFHPYDRWDFAKMDAETDDRYLRYLAARLSAYRNVWWSMANEFDLMKEKTDDDWDRFFKIVKDNDPYNHLRGIHNCRRWYDHTKPWVTHASLQTSNFQGGLGWREQYKKPILYDECRYEGNIPQGWGNISAKKMVSNFWWGTITGCYVGHGETYKHPEDILWWSKGGVLHGESPTRIAFLVKIMEQAPPFEDMTPTELSPGNYVLSKAGEHYLIYFTDQGEVSLDLPGDKPYKLDHIDTWNMDVISLGTASPGEFSFAAPEGDYLIRLSVYAAGEKMRPEAKASASPAAGIAPLKVQFSAPNELQCQWDFGDGNHSSEANPSHIYKKTGIYTAMLTVTDEAGLSASTYLSIGVDRMAGSPIVRVGFKDGDTPKTTLHGDIAQNDDGSYELKDGEPWGWISVDDEPIEDLEGLRSLAIMGWLNPSSMKTGSGGNRIASNLRGDRSGFDLVHLKDGSLKLAINEWPDRVRSGSSAGKIAIDKWTFFAVTYDGTQTEDNVKWYFGDADTPAELDQTTSYPRRQTGKGSGKLSIGNYNETMHRHGLDRQFRGKLRGIEIFGSRVGANGVLSLDTIRKHQSEE